MYGGVVFPVPPSDTLTGFVTNDLMEINAAVVQMEPEYLNISRSDVDQGPLIKVRTSLLFSHICLNFGIIVPHS